MPWCSRSTDFMTQWTVCMLSLHWYWYMVVGLIWIQYILIQCLHRRLLAFCVLTTYSYTLLLLQLPMSGLPLQLQAISHNKGLAKSNFFQNEMADLPRLSLWTLKFHLTKIWSSSLTSAMTEFDGNILQTTAFTVLTHSFTLCKSGPHFTEGLPCHPPPHWLLLPAIQRCPLKVSYLPTLKVSYLLIRLKVSYLLSLTV